MRPHVCAADALVSCYEHAFRHFFNEGIEEACFCVDYNQQASAASAVAASHVTANSNAKRLNTGIKEHQESLDMPKRGMCQRWRETALSTTLVTYVGLTFY